jgi:hypothetical protein
MSFSARGRELSRIVWSSPKSGLKFLVEVILVGLAVFLGLVANQWRDGRQHRELAAASLQYFRQDAVVNQKAILTVTKYHRTLARELDAFLNSDVPKTMKNFDAKVHFMGVRPVIFEHTAWDLALATQSLSYLDPQLAYALSRVYTRQQAFQTLENSYLQAAYTPTNFATDDMKGVATTMGIYLSDVNYQETDLLKLYEELIPQIDKAQQVQ